MLLLDEPVTVGSLTLYRDHASPATFHYLPGALEIVTEGGVPGIQLIRFRGSSQSGGILALDAQLRHDSALLSQVAAELASRLNFTPNLVPVLFNEAAARLTVLDFQPVEGAEGSPKSMFVEKVLGSSKPSLLGQQRAIFSARLSPEGTSLLEGALMNGGAPVLVVYDLQFSGLRAARGVRARIQYTMAYEYLRSRFTANTLYFKSDLDSEAESLARSGLIEIEDVDYKGVDAATLAKRAEEIRRTLSELMEGLFFRPAASPATLATEQAMTSSDANALWAAKGRPQMAFVLRALSQTEQAVITYDLSEMRVAARRIAPQGTIRPPAGDAAKQLILDVTTDWPPPHRKVRAFIVPGANWDGISAIQVDLRKENEVRTLVLSPEKPDLSTNLAAGPIDYKLWVIAAADPEALGNPSNSDAAFQLLSVENLCLDPSQLANRRVLRIAIGAVDFSIVSKISGRLQMNEHTRLFMLDRTRAEWSIPVWGNEKIQMLADFTLASGEAISLERIVHPTDSVVLINQPTGRFHLVEIMMQDPLQRYESIHVTLEAAAGARRQNFTLDASTPVAHWSSPRDAGSQGSFRYTTRKVLRNAMIAEEDWQEETGSLLVVGDRDLRIENIQGILLGATNSLGALIQLTSAAPPTDVDAQQEIVLDAGQSTFVARLPFRNAAMRKYSVAGQVFLESGTVELPAREESSEVLLIPVDGNG